MHGDDVGVIEGRRRLRFTLKAAPGRRIGEVVREELDRHGPVQIGIVRPIHHAHPADADTRLELIDAEALAGQIGDTGITDEGRGDRERRVAENAVQRPLRQQ